MEQINESERSRDSCTKIMKYIAKVLQDCISLSVDKDMYMYSVTASTKKISSGSLVINLRISLKENAEKCKYLVFVINRDDKTGMIHAFILDGDNYMPSVLFATTDQYPVNKLERYVPSIIASTQNMIK